MSREEFEYLEEKMNSKNYERLRGEFEALKNIKNNEDLEKFLNTYTGYKGGGIQAPTNDIEAIKNEIAYIMVEKLYRGS